MKQLTHFDAVALRKAGPLPENWAWCKLHRVGQDAGVITYAPYTVITRGKNKGRKRFGKERLEVVVTDAERDAEFARFESDTGSCGECYGKGETIACVSVSDGTTYRKCRRCKGDGKAPSVKEST